MSDLAGANVSHHQLLAKQYGCKIHFLEALSHVRPLVVGVGDVEVFVMRIFSEGTSLLYPLIPESDTARRKEAKTCVGQAVEHEVLLNINSEVSLGNMFGVWFHAHVDCLL